MWGLEGKRLLCRGPVALLGRLRKRHGHNLGLHRLRSGTTAAVLLRPRPSEAASLLLQPQLFFIPPPPPLQQLPFRPPLRKLLLYYCLGLPNAFHHCQSILAFEEVTVGQHISQPRAASYTINLVIPSNSQSNCEHERPPLQAYPTKNRTRRLEDS